jgi:hypothetical protein
MARISRDHARRRFEEGYPVTGKVLDICGMGYFSAATHKFGVKDWGDLLRLEATEAERHRLSHLIGGWVQPSPSRQTQDEAAGHVFRREPFKIGSLSGSTGTYAGWATGDLPQEYRGLVINAPYVVRSYETPIAWISNEGEIVIPSVRYSNTTTQHQRLVATALGQSFLFGEDGSVRKGRGKSPYGPGWQTRKWG